MTATKLLPLLLLAGLSCAPSVASAQTQAPRQGQPEAVQGEGMRVVIPPGWVQISSQSTPQLDYVWYGPIQERAQPIQDLLLYQEIKQPKGLSVDQVIEGMLNDAQRTCPELTTGNVQIGVMNGYQAGFVAATCPHDRAANKGRVSLVLTVAGRDSAYQVQRVWNTPPFQPGTSPVVSSQIDTWVSFLRGLKVCDTRYPQAHPCGPTAPTPNAPSQPPQ